MNLGNELRVRGITLVGVALVTICGALSGGCGDAVENRDEDGAYLRTRSTTLPAVNYTPTTSLFPVRIGDWWEYQVQAVTVQANGAQSLSEPVYRERGGPTLSVTSSGKTGIRFDYMREGRRVRSETYQHGRAGLFLLGAGTTETVAMSSPMPILRYPAREGDITPWDGRLDFNQSSAPTAPGRSFSRLTAQETVKTPLGAFKAWRVDTVIETNLGGRAVALIESRWLTPGVGVVRQESRSGNSISTRTLIGYKGAEKPRKRVQSPSKAASRVVPVTLIAALR